LNSDSDKSAFAQAYLSRFGRVANAATGEVFNDLVIFLDHHLKSDVSNSNLQAFLRIGTVKQVGTEMDDMELLEQSLSTLFKSIQDEIGKGRQQNIVELEKRKVQVTNYLALARKRLSTVTSKYWELVWDKTRGTPASPTSSTTTSAASSSSSSSPPSARSQATTASSSRSFATSVSNSDTSLWKRGEDLSSAKTSSNSPPSSHSKDKKADDWLKKAFESFSGLKELQEKFGAGSSKPKGLGSFGRKAEPLTTAPASSAPTSATTTSSSSTSSSKGKRVNDWLKRGVDSFSGLKDDLHERLGQRGAADDVSTRSLEVDDSESVVQRIPNFLQTPTASESSSEAANEALKRSVDDVSTRAAEVEDAEWARQRIPDFLKRRTADETSGDAGDEGLKRRVDEVSTRAVQVEDVESLGQKIPDFLKKRTASESSGDAGNECLKRSVDSVSGLNDVQDKWDQRGAADVSARFVDVEDTEWAGSKIPDFLKKSTVREAVAEKVQKQGMVNKFKRQEDPKNKVEIRCVPMGKNRIDFSDVIKKNNPAYANYLEQELQARKIAVPTNKDGTASFQKMKKLLKEWVVTHDNQAKIDAKLKNSFAPKKQELWGELLFTGNKCNNWTSPSDVADRDEMFFVFLMGVWRR
jgi:hypothetical protein